MEKGIFVSTLFSASQTSDQIFREQKLQYFKSSRTKKFKEWDFFDWVLAYFVKYDFIILT
jgi:hypothetical protein